MKKQKATLNSQASRPVFKAIPSIMPPLSPLAAPNPLLLDLLPSELRKGMVKRLHFDEEAQVCVIGDDEALSPKTAPIKDPLNFALVDKKSTLAVPSQPSRTNTHAKAGPLSDGSVGRSSPAGSKASSIHTTASTKLKVDIREVAPWIDFDADLTMPPPPEEPLIIHQRPIITQTTTTRGLTNEQDTTSPRLESREHLQNSVESFVSFNTTERHPEDRHERKKGGDSKGMLGEALSPQHMLKRDKKKSVAIRGRNIMSKLFDGVLDDEDELDGSPRHTLKKHSTSWKETLRLHPHMVCRQSSSNSSLKLAHRNAICPVNESACDISAAIAPNNNSAMIVTAIPYEDPFIEVPTLRRPKAMSMSMKNPISPSSLATTVGSAICASIAGRPGSPLKRAGGGSLAETRLRKMVKQL